MPDWVEMYSRFATNGINPLTGSWSPPAHSGFICKDLPFFPTYGGNLRRLYSLLYAKERLPNSFDEEPEDDLGVRKEVFEQVFEHGEEYYGTSKAEYEHISGALKYLKTIRVNWIDPSDDHHGNNVSSIKRALNPVLSSQREKQVPAQFEQAGWTWCFATDSRTVQAYVKHNGKLDQLRNRMAQLLGWRSVLANTECLGDKADQILDVFLHQYILFTAVWNSMTENLDTQPELNFQEKTYKQPARSYVANLQLFILENLSLLAWLAERCAYVAQVSNIRKNRISMILDTVTEAMPHIPMFTWMENLEHEMERERYLLLQLAKSTKFSPYHYFAGHYLVPGTGTCGSYC